MMYVSLRSIQWPLGKRGGWSGVTYHAQSFPKLHCSNDLHYPTSSRALYELFDLEADFSEFKKRIEKPTDIPSVGDDPIKVDQYYSRIDAVDASRSTDLIKEFRLSHGLDSKVQLFGRPRVSRLTIKRKSAMADIDLFLSPVDDGLFVKRRFLHLFDSFNTHSLSFSDPSGEQGEDWCEIEIREGGCCVRNGLKVQTFCEQCGEFINPFEDDGQDRLQKSTDLPMFRCYGTSELFVDDRFFREVFSAIKCDPEIITQNFQSAG